MPTPTEYKTVQARILAYARTIGWTCVPRGEAEKRRGVLQSLFRTLLHQLMTAQVSVHDLDLSALETEAGEPVGAG